MEEKAIRYLDDSDEDESAFTAESVPEEKKKSKKGNKELQLVDEKKPPIALICKVRFET
jgi:hypothetical protein